MTSRLDLITLAVAPSLENLRVQQYWRLVGKSTSKINWTSSLFLRQCLIYSRMSPNSKCSWWWPWTSDSLSLYHWRARITGRNVRPGFVYGALRLEPRALCLLGILPTALHSLPQTILDFFFFFLRQDLTVCSWLAWNSLQTGLNSQSPPVSASWVLGLKACIITIDLQTIFLRYK